MDITIPINGDVIIATATGIAIIWTAFQEYRHKVKYGSNIRFTKKTQEKK